MGTYDVTAIKEKQANKGKNKLSAQEMAILTREQNSDTEQLELEDSTTKSKTAKWFGFSSWLMNLFSNKIEFNFNGTVIKGKNGYQVRGGVVPLFPGAVLDLTPASLRGAIDPQTGFQTAKMEPGGGKPKLVLSPRGTSFIAEAELDEMSLGAKQGTGQEAAFIGYVNKQVAYGLGDGKIVTAERMQIEKNQITLQDTSLKADGQEKEVGTSVIDENGIHILEILENNEELEQNEIEEDTKTEEEEDAEEQGGFNIDAKTGDISYVDEENTDNAVKVNLRTGTFHFTFGKFFLDSDEEEEEENTEETQEEKKTLREILTSYYEDYKKEANEYLEKLGFAKDAFSQCCREKKLPVNPYAGEEEKEEKKMGIDAEVPIFPGLSFGVELEPSFSLGIGVTADLENTNGADKDQDVTVVYNQGEITSITYPEFDKTLKLVLMLKGNLGAKLSMILSAGMGYLFNVKGGIFAEGNLQGNIADTQEKTFAKAESTIGFTKRNKKDPLAIKDDIAMNFHSGLTLDGGVGTEGKVESKLFNWEKELWQYTFKEWHLADLKMDAKYKKKKNASIFSVKGWDRESSSIELNAFGKQIMDRKSDRYGLRIEQNQKIDLLTASADHDIEEMQKMVARLKEIQGLLGTNGGNFIAPESKIYQSLMEEMQQINTKLSAQIKASLHFNKVLSYQLDQLLKSKQWVDNMKMTQENIARHEERIKSIKEFQTSEKGLAMASNNAEQFKYYQKRFGAKEAADTKSEEDKKNATEFVAKKGRLIDYEKTRLQEIENKNNSVLEILKAYIKEKGITDLNKPNADFLKKYQSISNGKMLTQLGKYGDKESLVKYEKDALTKVTKKHTDRVEALKKKQEELGIKDNQLDQANEAFAKYYHKDLKGKALFKDLLHNHFNVEEVMEFERQNLNKMAEQEVGVLDFLQSRQAHVQNMENKGNILSALYAEKHARNYYFNLKDKKKILTDKKKWAKTASKQDILNYEYTQSKLFRQKQQKYVVLERNKVENQQNYLKVMEGSNFKEDKNWSNINSLYKDWAEKKSDDEIQELLSLEMLLRYEKEQKEIYAGKGKEEEKKQHENRENFLQGKLILANAEKNPEKKKSIIEETKKDYFSGSILGDTKDAIKDFKKGKLQEKELITLSIKDAISEHSAEHDQRIKKLLEFMGLEAESRSAEGSTKSDAQVYEYYEELCGMMKIKEFQNYWFEKNKDKEENITLDQMERYEMAMAREKTKSSYMQIAKEKNTVNSEEEKMAIEQAAKGGAFERYYLLKSMLKQGSTKEEIMTAYLKSGGAKLYEASLEKTMYQKVTPADIFSFEEGRISAIGTKHRERLELIESKGPDASFEDIEKSYRELAQVDGMSLKERAKAATHNIGLSNGSIGYDKSLKAEEVLTPQKILDYENRELSLAKQKHQERLDRLSGADVTDENAWMLYEEMGGGSGFKGAVEKEISQKEKEFRSEQWGFDKILVYEQGRIAYYEQLKEKANEPKIKLEQAQANLNAQVEECKKMQEFINSYTNEAGQQKVFDSKSGFDTFVADTSKADQSMKTAEKVSKESEKINKESKLQKDIIREMLISQLEDE